MRFIVSFEGEHRLVNMVFGAPMDMRGLLRWRTAAATRSDPQVRDALKFRKLATKRWRYYLKGNEAATSLRALKHSIRTNPSAEVGFLLMAKASWPTAAPVIGCCFCRRSWCHHLIVDFLAVHPKVLTGAGGRVWGGWHGDDLFARRAGRRTEHSYDLGRGHQELSAFLREGVELAESD